MASVGKIRPGVSLMNTSPTQLLKDAKYSRSCVVSVVNYTKWTLKGAGIKVYGGGMMTAQYSIRPGTVEAVVATKTAYTATGSSGTLSYLVEGLDQEHKYVNIMWSVPFDYIWYKNWLGIEVSSVQSDFCTMYYNQDENRKISMFHKALIPIEVMTDGLIITGEMGSNTNAEALIEVKPTDPINEFGAE